jgi:dTMP kinase
VFVTLEGPDGSGKSSLLRGLAARLAAAGCDVVATREPGSTPLGEQVRRLVLDTEPRIDRTGRADALLFAASRA